LSKILFPDQLSYLEKRTTNNDDLLSKMEFFAKKNNIPILDKLSSKFLEQLVYMYSPQKVLEIGTAIGYSTIRVAKLLQNESFIDTIELSNNNISIAKSFIKEAQQEKKIRILSGNAKDILPILSTKYDLIFLDADKEDYIELFNLSIKLLKKGGVYLVDNLLWKGYSAAKNVPPKYEASANQIRKFNDIFLNYAGLKSNILPIGDGLGLGIRT